MVILNDEKDEGLCGVEGYNNKEQFIVFLDDGEVIEKMRVYEENLMGLRRGWLGDKSVKYKSISWP